LILPAIKHPTEDFEELERRMLKVFRDLIYIPLLKEIGFGRDVFDNAEYDLINAILKGRVTFYRGIFRGKFSAAISKDLKRIGAKYDRSVGWRLPLKKVPPEIEHAVKLSHMRFKTKIDAILKKLSDVQPSQVAEAVKSLPLFDSTLWKTEQLLQKSVKNITVMPKLKDEERKKIAQGYTENLERYIKEWTEKEVLSLRERVEKSTMEGNRYENMVKTIQSSYGVSASKAKFLARQETNLMLAEYNQTRYQSAGINEYVWACVVGSPNHPVRPMHKALEGKTFRFDQPPITDDKGSRNNPGQDYNCRCMAKPVIRFS
jgi:SPP1 gp7 family putative phage head morphogenesis protein